MGGGGPKVNTEPGVFCPLPFGGGLVHPAGVFSLGVCAFGDMPPRAQLPPGVPAVLHGSTGGVAVKPGVVGGGLR